MPKESYHFYFTAIIFNWNFWYNFSNTYNSLIWKVQTYCKMTNFHTNMSFCLLSNCECAYKLFFWKTYNFVFLYTFEFYYVLYVPYIDIFRANLHRHVLVCQHLAETRFLGILKKLYTSTVEKDTISVCLNYRSHSFIAFTWILVEISRYSFH